MDIEFESNKLAKEFSDDKKLKRERGDRQAKLIRQRLSELKAAVTLTDMRKLPAARCHELTGDLKGLISVDLDGPYRLLFWPNGEGMQRRSDGSLVHESVTAVVIKEVTNTHE